MPTLTAIAVQALQPKDKRYDVADSKVPGLVITVLPSGAKSWSVRYTFAGKDRRFTIGNASAIKLDAARQAAGAALRSVAVGVDPQAAKVEERRKASENSAGDALIKDLYDQYIREHVKPNTAASSLRVTENLFKLWILPKLGKKRIADITEQDVIDAYTAVKKKGHATTANKVFVHLRTFFRWGTRHRIFTNEPTLKLKKPYEENSRVRILSDQEIVWFWRACEAVGYPFGPAGKLLLLTGARRGEVQFLNRKEIVDRVWILPAERVKNGIEHRIHISDLAVSAINEATRVKSKHGFLFTTDGENASSGYGNSKICFDREMKKLAKADGEEFKPWVFHDLRRTAASGMARLGVALPVIERCLNHISGSFAGIVGVYQQHQYTDEMRNAFTKWGEHVASLVTHPALPHPK